MTHPRVTNPRAEATSLLPVGFEGRVLEPSPPASTDPEWWADDPTDPTAARGSVVTPIPGEGFTWEAMAETDSQLSAYAFAHWLIARRPLRPLPAGYPTSRLAFHRLAFFALAPKRYGVTGRLGLRFTHGGFGTPFFGDDEQVRVEAGSLVYQRRDDLEWWPLTTVAEACEHLEIPYREVWFDEFHDPLEPGGAAAPVAVEEDAAGAIADWFGFASLLLERFRRLADGGVTRVQLWPEHFDVAVEAGCRRGGTWASYGASPGDGKHPEPHLYVAPWEGVDRADPYWNDAAFNGASLPYWRLLEAAHPVQAGLDFLIEGHHRLCR